MRIKLGVVIFDPQEGFGSVPHQLELEYRGFAVIMSPKTFTQLVPTLTIGQSAVDSVDYVAGMGQKILDGAAVAPPFLSVDFQNKAGPRIVSHEGRHRVLAIQSITKNNPNQMLLVHIFPTGGMRARHLTSDTIIRFRNKAFVQNKNKALSGPLFGPKIWFNSQWLDLEHDLEPAKEPKAGTPVLAQVERRLSVFLQRKGIRL